MKLLGFCAFLPLCLLLGSPTVYSQEDALCSFEKPVEESGMDYVLQYLKGECLPKLKKIYECSARAEIASAELAEIYENFFVSKPEKSLFVSWTNSGSNQFKDSNFDPLANFNAIKADHMASLEAIEDFSTKMSNLSDDSISNKLLAIEKAYSALLLKLKELSLKETQFINFYAILLPRLESQYNDMLGELNWLTSIECKDASIKEGILGLKESVELAFGGVENLRRYVLEARRARDILHKHVYKTIRYQTEQAYRDKLKKDLGALKSEIDAILEIDRISTNFETWWLSNKTDRTRANEEFRYLQYSRPLNMYKIDLLTIKNYESAIALYKENFPESTDSFTRRLAGAREFIESKINALEAKSWQGVLKRQIRLAEARVARASSYEPTCIDALEKHLNIAQEVQNYNGFLGAEASYKEAMKTCGY